MGEAKTFWRLSAERTRTETEANRKAALQTVCSLVRQYGLSVAEIETGVLSPVNSNLPILARSRDKAVIASTRWGNLKLLANAAETLQD